MRKLSNYSIDTQIQNNNFNFSNSEIKNYDFSRFNSMNTAYNFVSCMIVECNLKLINFKNCLFKNTVFVNCNFTFTDFENCIIEDCQFINCCQMVNQYINCKLCNCIYERTDLITSYLQNCFLEHIQFSNLTINILLLKKSILKELKCLNVEFAINADYDYSSNYIIKDNIKYNFALLIILLTIQKNGTKGD